MNETVITVRGEFTAMYPAERALVQVDVSFDGPERQAVFESATRAADTVRGTVTALHHATNGPVTEWASDSITVWSERPWNNEGAQLPLVYHARISLSARFSDFAALSRWIEDVLGIEGVGVSSIQWSLTRDRITTVTAEVRSRAVKDAVAKATIYAQSIGLGSVRAIAIADPGMLGDQGASMPPAAGFRANSMAMMKSGQPELSLKPEEIEVGVVVDARFIAS